MEKPMQIKGAVKYGAYQGLDKQQCSVHLTIFADGVRRVCPLVIFRGKGLRITCKEQAKSLGPQSAGCVSTKSLVRRINDEKWISEQWGNIFINPPTTGSTAKILVADMHRAQQADGVKALLKKKNTELVNVPLVVLVGFNLLMFLLISHLRMLLDNSLRSILRRTCNGILKEKSVPLKEEY